jgi:dihydroxyacid dehydratase/phosphogluconate dehydratase
MRRCMSMRSPAISACRLSVRDWQTHGHKIPLLVNMMPAGKYLGEEFYRAGGIPAVIAELIEPARFTRMPRP